MDWNNNMLEAPKDREILVYCPVDDHVFLVNWGKEEVYYPGCKARWTWCLPGTHQDEQGGCLTVENPTHWMEVPEKPKV